MLSVRDAKNAHFIELNIIISVSCLLSISPEDAVSDTDGAGQCHGIPSTFMFATTRPSSSSHCLRLLILDQVVIQMAAHIVVVAEMIGFRRFL